MPLGRLGLALLALALLAAGLALHSARRPEAPPSIRGDDRTSIVAGDVAAAAVRDSSEGLRAPPIRPSGAERRATDAEPRALGVPAVLDLVRVHGRVLRGGLGVESCSVSFRAARDGGEADWDLTDSEGCFAVRLEPGRYRLASDDEAAGAWTEDVLVPAGAAGLELDVRLP